MQRIIGKINRHGEADRVIAEARPGTVNAHRALITIQRSDESAETAELLRSTPSESQADLRLAASVDRALRTAGYLELRELPFSVDHGWITLRGCMRTYYLKQLAQATVMSVAGVESVDNQIVVA